MTDADRKEIMEALTAYCNGAINVAIVATFKSLANVCEAMSEQIEKHKLDNIPPSSMLKMFSQALNNMGDEIDKRGKQNEQTNKQEDK